MTRVITFGTFDVFHIGHLSILERASELGDHLTVGVSTDSLSFSKKGRRPYYSQDERIAIVQALRCVDSTFLEHSLDDKPAYVENHKADILVMGNDWSGQFDNLQTLCQVVYLPRTPSISTTAVIEKIRT